MTHMGLCLLVWWNRPKTRMQPDVLAMRMEREETRLSWMRFERDARGGEPTVFRGEAGCAAWHFHRSAVAPFLRAWLGVELCADEMLSAFAVLVWARVRDWACVRDPWWT